MYRFLLKELWSAVLYDFHSTTIDFELVCSILNYIQIASPRQKEMACNLLFFMTWKQPLILTEFIKNRGLQIVTQSVLRHRHQHSDNIVVQVIQIVSCAARKSKDILPEIERAGVLQLIPSMISIESSSSLEIREKTCNLVGNLCKHSGRFLPVIGRETVLKSLCECTTNQKSSDMRRFACYAIGNIAYQATKQKHSPHSPLLTMCIEPLAQRLNDRYCKTQVKSLDVFAFSSFYNLLSRIVSLHRKMQPEPLGI